MPVTLADSAVQKFLATKDVVVLATVKPDGAPLAMPMWFLHDPASLTMISVDNLKKVDNLRREPRVCVAAEAVTAAGAIKGVVVQGRAEFLGDTPERRALVERFLVKYDPRLAEYWKGRAMPPNRVMFRITPSKVLAWGLD
jgi:PPOX class probable F420-dependent enzyme